ncbi:MAG: phosphomannomutase/phosphoglucomutase [Candidatus Levybacteria bacterium]|nr:phosphomannomutase/phosphoglucomutase [Candidatus Levybacteria bacterium]
MNINPVIFKSYDIRGIYPTDLNEKNISSIVKAIYTFFMSDKEGNEPLKIVVGTDMRISSPSLTKEAIQTLVELGANVIDIGIVSTPTFYFSVNHYGYDAGIQITASHNPKEWNGIKIVKNSQKGLIKIGKSTGMEEIKRMAVSGESIDSSGKGSVVQKTGILGDEIENALKISGNPQVKSFKIVADAANAMGSQYINIVFEKIPGNLIRMNFVLDGNFPAHQPDPLQPENLVDLQKRVLEEKADLGLAPDGDGDRLFFVDEKGQVVQPTIITSIVAKEMLKINPGETILFDIRYIMTPQKIVEENGGKSLITKVGHAFITESLHESQGIFAGESSGHYYFRQTGNAESQMPIIITILKVLSESGKTMSELVKEYSRSFESGEFNFKVENANGIIEKIREKYNDGNLNTMDGIAINYPDWRFSLRSSNTEPLIRLNVESYEKDVMEKKRDELIGIIKENS